MKTIPKVSNLASATGHFEEFCANPALFLTRAQAGSHEALCRGDRQALQPTLDTNPSSVWHAILFQVMIINSLLGIHHAGVKPEDYWSWCG